MKNSFLTRIFIPFLRQLFSQKSARKFWGRSRYGLGLCCIVILSLILASNWHAPVLSNQGNAANFSEASNPLIEAAIAQTDSTLTTSQSDLKVDVPASQISEFDSKTTPTLNPNPEGKISPYPSDMQRLMERGYIIVGTLGFDTPPFYFAKAGKLIGSDIELARNIGQLLDLEVRFDRQSPTFNELIERTARGEVDMAIGKLSVTMPRLKQLHASPSYIKFKQAVLINRTQLATQGGKDSQSIQKILREDPIKIGVIDKSSYQRYAEQNFPKAEIVGFQSWTEATQAVEKGEVFAIYRDEAEIKKIVLSQPQLALKLKSVLFNDLEDNKAIFVNLNNPQLAHIIDYVLTDVYQPWTTEKLIAEFHEVFTNPEFASN